MSKGLFNNDTAAVDYSNIFSEEESYDSLSTGLVDAGSEMDGLGFFGPSTVPEQYQPPSHDIASDVMPIEDTTVFTPISESIGITDVSSCSCCSSTGRPESSSAYLSSAGHSTGSLAAISPGRTSPEDVSRILTCQCLDQALQLLKKVSGPLRMSSSVDSQYSGQSSEVVSRTSSTTPDGDEPSSIGFGESKTQPQWFEATLSQNRQCLGAMDTILACPATGEDSMLPMILCMIFLKILDRYSNMAWNQLLLYDSYSRDSAELGSNISGYLIMETGQVAPTTLNPCFDRGTSQPSDDEYFGRATAHLVLGELHWVQRVLDQLVARLKCPDLDNASRPTQESGGWESRQQTTPLPMKEPADSGLKSSFSASTLEHMTTDVQDRLTMLSTSIIDQLRQS